MKQLLALATVLLITNGCTSVNVRPVAPEIQLTNVCIEENPKVIVEGFLNVVRDGFSRHGIATRVVQKPIPSDCEIVLTYTAFKTWDFASYLHHAELLLEKDGIIIGTAEYHLVGQGGFSLNKWQSTKTKMDPVIDKLLENIK